jgi:hypothetical protein
MVTKLIQTKIRLSAALLARLEASAKRNKISFNAEAARRIEQTFSEEAALGGPAAKHIFTLIASAFMVRGQRAAGSRKIDSWINDPKAYEEAMFGALETLMINQPGTLTPDEIQKQTDRIAARITARRQNMGIAS